MSKDSVSAAAPNAFKRGDLVTIPSMGRFKISKVNSSTHFTMRRLRWYEKLWPWFWHTSLSLSLINALDLRPWSLAICQCCVCRGFRSGEIT